MTSLFSRILGRSKAGERAEAVVVETKDVASPQGGERTSPLARGQAVELGDINYVNLTRDQRHGEPDLRNLLEIAATSQKPIFVNFVEWAG